MRGSIISKFAMRSLGRNIRRTILSLVGVGVGCAVAIFMASFMRGSNELRIRSIADSGFGHARIAPAAWEKRRENDLRLQDWQATLATVRNMDGVKVAAPHARTTALLAFGTRVSGVEMLGVDPSAEVHINRLTHAVAQGRYLETGDQDMVVIGSATAERFEVELDDDLFMTVVDHEGNMQYNMLRIVGIVHTGSREIDGSICHVMLEDLARFTGYQGAGEISITFEDPFNIDGMAQLIRPALPAGNVLLTWREVLPGQGGDAASDQAFMNLLAGIVVVVVILGITSAQLTAILERKREFAVLMAVGMKSVQVVRLVFIEATAMGILGAFAGLLIVMPLVYYTATSGIDFAAILGDDLAISGVLFDPVLYADMGLWMIPYALIIATVSTLIAAIYPAFIVIRTNPTAALSLREA